MRKLKKVRKVNIPKRKKKRRWDLAGRLEHRRIK
jgi:hypothetical protein